MANLQLESSHHDELLASQDVEEPLITGGPTRLSHVRTDATPLVDHAHRDARPHLDQHLGQTPTRAPRSSATLWDASMQESLGIVEGQNRAVAQAEIERAHSGHRRGRYIDRAPRPRRLRARLPGW